MIRAILMIVMSTLTHYLNFIQALHDWVGGGGGGGG